MTEEELNRLEAVVRKRAALGDIDSEPSLSLIALARVGLAADGMRRALTEIADGDEAAWEIAFHALSLLPKPEQG